ncbi:MAG: PEP-CTERM sorting domain-containing protein [Myxococcota bacterium]
MLMEKMNTKQSVRVWITSIVATGMVLVAGGASASPIGLNYDVNWDDWGVAGGADIDQTVVFDGTSKTIGDTTLSEQARPGGGGEVIEFNVQANAPLDTLSGGSTAWRIGFDNIVWNDGDLRERTRFFVGFSVAGSFITASPLTGSFFQSTHPIDGHSVIELIPQHPTLPGPGDNVGSSSGGFASFDGLLDILVGSGAIADTVDGIQIGMVVQPIPEPGTALLMGLGLAGLAARRRS